MDNLPNHIHNQIFKYAKEDEWMIKYNIEIKTEHFGGNHECIYFTPIIPEEHYLQKILKIYPQIIPPFIINVTHVQIFGRGFLIQQDNKTFVIYIGSQIIDNGTVTYLTKQASTKFFNHFSKFIKPCLACKQEFVIQLDDNQMIKVKDKTIDFISCECSTCIHGSSPPLLNPRYENLTFHSNCEKNILKCPGPTAKLGPTESVTAKLGLTESVTAKLGPTEGTENCGKQLLNIDNHLRKCEFCDAITCGDNKCVCNKICAQCYKSYCNRSSLNKEYCDNCVFHCEICKQKFPTLPWTCCKCQKQKWCTECINQSNSDIIRIDIPRENGNNDFELFCKECDKLYNYEECLECHKLCHLSELKSCVGCVEKSEISKSFRDSVKFCKDCVISAYQYNFSPELKTNYFNMNNQPTMFTCKKCTKYITIPFVGNKEDIPSSLPPQ